MKSFSKVLIAGFVVTLCACNSGGASLPSGLQCGDTAAIPTTASPGQKPVPMKPSDNQSAPADSQMPKGIYTYASADLVYSEKPSNNPKPFKIQVHDNVAADVSVSQSVACSKNAISIKDVPESTMTAVTDIIVCNDYSQIVKTRTVTFSIKEGTVTFPAPKPTGLCLDSTDAVYPKDASNAILLKNPAGDIEVRTADDIAGGTGNLSLVVHMGYVAYSPVTLEPPECATKTCTPAPPPTPTAKSQTKK